jgi:hypothetical protein
MPVTLLTPHLAQTHTRHLTETSTPTYTDFGRLGSSHLARDSIELGHETGPTQLSYGQGIVDEALQWNRDRESSSVSSVSEAGSGVTSGESSAQSSRGLDPNTLYFKKEDVIMLVDGECGVTWLMLDSYDTRR